MSLYTHIYIYIHCAYISKHSWPYINTLKVGDDMPSVISHIDLLYDQTEGCGELEVYLYAIYTHIIIHHRYDDKAHEAIYSYIYIKAWSVVKCLNKQNMYDFFHC